MLILLKLLCEFNFLSLESELMISMSRWEWVEQLVVTNMRRSWAGREILGLMSHISSLATTRCRSSGSPQAKVRNLDRAG